MKKIAIALSLLTGAQLSAQLVEVTIKNESQKKVFFVSASANGIIAKGETKSFKIDPAKTFNVHGGGSTVKFHEATILKCRTYVVKDDEGTIPAVCLK